jgi:uncharacterized membrane protein YgcG
LKVTWHFNVQDSTHAFTLNYRVRGVVRTGDGADTLVYTPLPREHDYTIPSSTVRVRYPQDARLQGEPSISNGSLEPARGLATFHSSNLGENQAPEIRLTFAPGSLGASTPAWQAATQAASQRSARDLPLFTALSATLALLGGLGIWSFWRRQAPAALPIDYTYARTTQPPSNLPPALAGALLNNGHPQQDALLSTLFDLASRGALTVAETPRQHWYSGQDYTLTLQSAAGLRPFEITYLQTAFKTPALLTGMQTTIQAASREVQNKWPAISAAITTELENGGWTDAQRVQLARSWTMTAGAALILAFAALIGSFFLVNPFSPWVVLPFMLLVLLAIAWLVTALALTRLSECGRREAAQWKAFREYLRQAARDQARLADASLLETWLPLAAGMGLVGLWAERIKHSSALTSAPPWFQSLASGDDGFAAFVTMMDTTSTSTMATGDGGGGGSAGGGSSSTG